MVMGGATGAVGMASMALSVSVLAPALVLAFRDHVPDRLSRVPAPLALGGFVVLHDTVMVTGDFMAAPVHLLAGAAVLAGAFVFWLPVVGSHHLSDAGRIIYLFVSCPTLDISAVAMIGITGHSAAGLAMIVGMLPIGGVEVFLFWRWAVDEERTANQAAPIPARAPGAGWLPEQVGG